MSGSREDVGKVPAKSDELGGCGFVVGSGGLRRLGGGDETGRCRVGDAGHFCRHDGNPNWY